MQKAIANRSLCSMDQEGEEMKVEMRDFTKEEFHKYLIDNFSSIFEEETRDAATRVKWMKIYCLLVSREGWQSRVFHPDEITMMGEVIRFAPKEGEDQDGQRTDEPEEYYIVEYKPGLLLMFTSASNETYHKDLGRRIRRSRGITPMWMHPEVFDNFWHSILTDTDGIVYYFAARRDPGDEAYCKVRPHIKRRLNYTGDDTKLAMEELRELYGVTPEVVYVEAENNLKLHISNNGLFSAQRATEDVLALFYRHLDQISKSVLQLREIASDIRMDFISENNLRFPSIEAGVITLSAPLFDEAAAERMRSSIEGFSFIDVHTEIGSISLTATVVDDNKRCVFSVNATEDRIVVVPKFRTTFESFISFYRGVVETVDAGANFDLLRVE